MSDQRPPYPTHRHRNSNSAIATEHNRSPWLDPLFYGEGIADEKARQQRAAAAAAAARARHSHHSRAGSFHGSSPVAFTPESADAAEAGAARYYNGNGSRSWDRRDSMKGRRGGLIALARNRWEQLKGPSPGEARYLSAGSGSAGGGLGGFFRVFRSPRRLFRPRTLLCIAAVVLTYMAYSKVMETVRFYQEERMLLKSLDWRTRQRAGGWFGGNKVPEFPDVIYMDEMDQELLPASQPAPAGQRSSKRLIVVGDVHGCLEELQELLNDLDFAPEQNDHLIFTGGIIGGGPFSPDTVDLARTVSASCVRGFAEDRVLLTRTRIQAIEKLIRDDEEHESETVKLAVLLGEEPGVVGERELAERRLARELTQDQADWLAQCPVILKLGDIRGDESVSGSGSEVRRGEDLGDVVVVHGGLVPGVPLEEQDPLAVMTVRTVDADLHVPYDAAGGVNWARMYDKEQQILAAAAAKASNDPEARAHIRKPTTVLYGHDLLDSPSIRRYTKGLNTACYLGGKLTAFVIEDGGMTSIASVSCPNRGKDDKDSSGNAKRDETRSIPGQRRWLFGWL